MPKLYKANSYTSVTPIGTYSSGVKNITGPVPGPYSSVTVTKRIPTGDTILPGFSYNVGILLLDGTVMLLPNMNGGRIYIYNPATNEMKQGPVVIDHHSSSTLTLLPDGRVVIMPNSYAIRIYNPTTNAITEGPIVYGNSGALLPDGRVILTPFTSSTTETVKIYNPTTNTIATGPVINGELQGSCKLLPDGKVLFLPYSISDNKLKIYDPTTNTFTLNTTLANTITSNGSILLPDGRVLILSGRSDVQMKIFDTATNTITKSISFPNDGYFTQFYIYGGTLLPDGKVMFIPQRTRNPNGTAIYIYDPITSIITSVFAISPDFLNMYEGTENNYIPPASIGAVVLLSDGKMFALVSHRNPGSMETVYFSVIIIDGPWTAFDPTYMLSPYLNKF